MVVANVIKIIIKIMEEKISAFAFNVGKELEKMVEERNGNLSKQLESLQSSIFNFRRELKNTENENMLKLYDLYFNIEINKNEKI